MRKKKTEDISEKTADIMIDNYLLKKRIQNDYHISVDSKTDDPAIEKAFLTNMIEYEEADKGPRCTLRSLLPAGFDLPPVEQLSRRDLRIKLEAIQSILSGHNISIDFLPKLPDAVAYQYLLDQGLNEEVMRRMPKGFMFHLDGCSGNCDQCFQRDYCDAFTEMERRENGGG
ncbi:hypothetical protein HY768_00690 [candidate division TA06 bacterium]|uniref:Uncharacterized protein n=1 Tax=candidate division TA06 bacterium TaxID=2250710 RepID=A0A933IAL1_UNCT6|nr:hypothetical protein [candidate division TA06 bacterium]